MHDPDKTGKIPTITRYKPVSPRVGLVRALEVASQFKPPAELGRALEELIEKARQYAAEEGVAA